MPPATDGVAAALEALAREVETCRCCGLHATRTRPVPGEGDPHAELMFVGEAPGYHEDQQGRPFVGQAGKLLDELLRSINLRRDQVYITNVLKSRPPNNRDPLPDEVEACRPYLWRQIELMRPKVICTLGNHATRLLTGDPTGITKVHGRPRVLEIGGEARYLYPIYHPAAALYTRSMLTTLQDDFARLPELLASPRPGLSGGGGFGSAGQVETGASPQTQQPAASPVEVTPAPTAPASSESPRPAPSGSPPAEPLRPAPVQPGTSEAAAGSEQLNLF